MNGPGLRKALVAAWCLGIMEGSAIAAYTSFYWKQDSDNYFWTTCANWEYVGPEPVSCHPTTTDHKVMVPYIGDVQVIHLPNAAYSVNDMLIQDDAQLHSAGTSQLRPRTFEIQGGVDGSVVSLPSESSSITIDVNTNSLASCPDNNIT